MPTKRLIGTIVGLAIVAGALLTPALTIAQDGGVRNQNIPVLELDQADVRDALKIIFKTVNANYTVSQEVQGTVTVHLRDVPFETALRNVLNQVTATYRVEGGVYVIIPKPNDTITPNTNTNPDTPATQSTPIVKIKIKAIDPELVAMILAGTADIGQQPETSTGVGIRSGTGGGGGFSGGMSGGGFSGGGFSGGMSGGGFGGGGFSGGGFGGGGFGGGGFSGGGGFGGGGFSGGGGGGFGGGR